MTITITTSAVNHPPVANNDSYSTVVNTTLTVGSPGVLANDTDPDGDSLTAILVSGPTNGTLNLNTNGGFSYTPSQQFYRDGQFYLPSQRWINELKSCDRDHYGHNESAGGEHVL